MTSLSFSSTFFSLHGSDSAGPKSCSSKNRSSLRSDNFLGLIKSTSRSPNGFYRSFLSRHLLKDSGCPVTLHVVVATEVVLNESLLFIIQQVSGALISSWFTDEALSQARLLLFWWDCLWQLTQYMFSVWLAISPTKYGRWLLKVGSIYTIRRVTLHR